MALPPLPKLPRKGTDPDKVRAPKLKKAEIPIMEPALPDEVTPAELNYDLRKGAAISPTEEGRWFETTTANGTVGGRCSKCGRLRKAENLVLYQRPFGRGEEWRCKGSCR